jgi:putative transposase
VRSVKTECTGRMVFFSRSSLERALMQYVTHYHEERNHQGLQNRLLKCSDGPINLGGRIERRERLGGMLNFYHRAAA